MQRFEGDPEFTLRWPPELFAEEARQLVARAGREGVDYSWRVQAETLLRQAFVTTVPVSELERILDRRASWGDMDEEPF